MIRDIYTAQKTKFSINDFFSKCDQIRLMENVIFCSVLGARKGLHTNSLKAPEYKYIFSKYS